MLDRKNKIDIKIKLRCLKFDSRSKAVKAKLSNGALQIAWASLPDPP